jgi:ankyrin repeat protein
MHTSSDPFALASNKGNVDIARFLIQPGANFNARDSFPNTTRRRIANLRLQAFWQTTTRMRTFETKYARPPYMQPRSWLNCSFVCSSSGSRGTNVDSRDTFWWTPQRDASRYGHLQVLQELMDNGANVNARNTTIGPRYIFQHATDTLSNRYLNLAQTCMC